MDLVWGSVRGLEGHTPYRSCFCLWGDAGEAAGGEGFGDGGGYLVLGGAFDEAVGGGGERHSEVRDVALTAFVAKAPAE